MGINAPFLDQPDEDLICQICHGVLDQPITLCQQGYVERATGGDLRFYTCWNDPRPTHLVPLYDTRRHTYCKSCMHGWIHRPRPKSNGGGSKPAPAPHCPGCMLPLGAEVRVCVQSEVMGDWVRSLSTGPIHAPAAALLQPTSHSSTALAPITLSQNNTTGAQPGGGESDRQTARPLHKHCCCCYGGQWRQQQQPVVRGGIRG